MLTDPSQYGRLVRDWDTFNADVIAEFRSNGGEVARFGGLPVVIVHTIGARSGTVREVPLIPVFLDDQMLLFGTAAGSPAHPAWYFNLRAHPRVTVEYGTETYTADVALLPDADADRLVSRQAESAPQLAEYVASASPRVIPVFSINRR
jgi:deazaflavin-dependent oxidoreductase (nitroreductase family)